jgi:hypothetical protein
MDSELRSTPFAAGHVVDARLTDPHLQSVVERARRAAAEDGHAVGFADGYAAGVAAAASEAASGPSRPSASAGPPLPQPRPRSTPPWTCSAPSHGRSPSRTGWPSSRSRT